MMLDCQNMTISEQQHQHESRLHPDESVLEKWQESMLIIIK